MLVTSAEATTGEVSKILAAIKPLEKEWKEGKARTPELTELSKHNEELEWKGNDLIGAIVKAHAHKISTTHELAFDHVLFGVSKPKFNRFRKKRSGVASDYQRHTDAPLMGRVRTDLACTTFLRDPNSYKGGELNIEDLYGKVHTYKGKIGECVVYPCGQPHWVSKVTKGERLALICWIESYVKDSYERQLIANFGKSLAKIEHLTFEDKLMREVWTELGSVQTALMKKWMQR